MYNQELKIYFIKYLFENIENGRVTDVVCHGFVLLILVR